MKMLEDRIRKDGIVREGNVLKVDSFINHQMDIPLFREMAKEWKRLFAGKPINKVLTIEASGIGIAAVVASELNVPVVFAKKSMSINLDYDNYKTQIQSFTHKKIYNVIVSKKFLTPEDHVLIIEQGSLRESTMKALQEEKFQVVEMPFRPTAENFARYFYELFTLKGYPVAKVEVYETPNNSAVYFV